MKLWLDDERKAPFGWTRVKTADECIAVLDKGGVIELSLDHDLAHEHYAPRSPDAPPYKEKTGMYVVDWMIEQWINRAEKPFTWPSVIYLHTLNPVGCQNMRAALHRHTPEEVRCVVKPAYMWKEG